MIRGRDRERVSETPNAKSHQRQPSTENHWHANTQKTFNDFEFSFGMFRVLGTTVSTRHL